MELIDELLKIIDKLQGWDLLLALDFIFVILSVKFASHKTIRISLIHTFALLGVAIIIAKAITSMQV